jgi:hypothetical protein
MSSDPLTPQQIEALDALCCRCPKGIYEEGCPFSRLQMVSYAHRMSIFSEMSKQAAASLFELINGCKCPGDFTRSENPPPKDPGH